MHAQEDIVLNLGDLPSDVIRKIIAVGLDSIDDVKLITPRWNIFVRENLKDRTPHPIIKDCDCNWSGTAPFTIVITFSIAYRKYFGMQNKPIVPHRSGFPFQDSDVCCEFEVNAAQIESGAGKDIDFMRKVFARCSSVEFFHVKFGANQNNLVKFATDPINIDEFRVTGILSQHDVNEIIKFVKENSVHFLYLSIFDFNNFRATTNFFTEVLSAVQTVKLDGYEYSGNQEQLEENRNIHKETTNWLNLTGKITATFEEEPGNNNFTKMCITVKRTTDI